MSRCTSRRRLVVYLALVVGIIYFNSGNGHLDHKFSPGKAVWRVTARLQTATFGRHFLAVIYDLPNIRPLLLANKLAIFHT